MEETKKIYEALVMISCKSGGDGVSSIVEKLKNLVEKNAQLQSFKEWGKRKLAYSVNKEPEAYYVLYNFVSEAGFPNEFSRICRITDGILRAMVLKCIERKKKPAKKIANKTADSGLVSGISANSEVLEDMATSGTSEMVKATEFRVQNDGNEKLTDENSFPGEVEVES